MRSGNWSRSWHSNAASPPAHAIREIRIHFEVNLYAPPLFADRHFRCSRRDRICTISVAPQLEPEKTFHRNLAAGGTDLFALDLKTDQIVQLTLEDQGKDVILSVYSPDGRLSRAFSSERQKGGALQFLATQPGRWGCSRRCRADPRSHSVSRNGRHRSDRARDKCGRR